MTVMCANRSLTMSVLFVAICSAAKAPGLEAQTLEVQPRSVQLHGPESRQQLQVSARSEGRLVDHSRAVTYQSEDPHIASISKSGQITPHGEGLTRVRITDSISELIVPVVVRGWGRPRPVSFQHEVLPILTKAGCNSGGCHGKAEGQNGFKLSVFAFDPVADHDAIAKDGRGRRVSTTTVGASLLLRKATGEAPHGGGARLKRDHVWYQMIARWIAEGATYDDGYSAATRSIEVQPAHAILQPDSSFQLRVTAIDEAGRRKCVTSEAEYESNAETVASADQLGIVSVSDVPGEAAILVRYMGKVGVCRVTLPQSDADFQRPPIANFIDEAVWNKLDELEIPPSNVADDSMFLRRVYLDTVGTLPTVAEARSFLSDKSPEKRARLIDELLKHEAYAQYRAMRWADILRIDKSIVGVQGTVAMTRWLRQQFEENTPYDELTRRVVMARGSTMSESPAAFYQVHKDPEMAGRALSQVFLGVRIECAQCHHHPFEKWSQSDYFAFAGFFTGINRKKAAPGLKIVDQPLKHLKHPRTGEEVQPAGLGAMPLDPDSVGNPRAAIAEWMTADSNPFFARMIANRLWAHYFGRGLVEPIDDLRATNPATNEPLLDALAQHLVEVKYDLKAFTRTLLNSRVYQLSSASTDFNARDAQNFSHQAWKPMPAEVLLDAICQATEVSEQFNGWPEGVRAIEVWDNRMPSYFFKVFGRPQRVSVCECERGDEPSIAQALHLMNSPETVHKIRHRRGRAARLAASPLEHSALIEELYLATLSRYPTKEEVQLMDQAFDRSPDERRQAVEDILWALMNTREFVYNR